jgi:hypothetical protein
MTTPEHAREVIDTSCRAEAERDRDTRLALFAADVGLVTSLRAFVGPTTVTRDPK